MIWNEILKTEENRKKYADFVSRADKDIHSFLEFDAEKIAPPENTEGCLAGLPFGVKDNIAVKDFKLTCASKILENFVSPYNATAIEKLEKAGCVPVGKTNMDEFGMGSSTDCSAFGGTNNPWNKECVTGGSSGGSAAAVAAGLVPFALGSDTGGSVRQPAAFCGVYGLKPTYGSVSRFGLVAYASSLDVIGVVSRDLDLAEKVFEVIRGEDEKDQTSIPYPEKKAEPVNGKLSFTYLEGDLGLTPEIEKGYRACIQAIRDRGFEIKGVQIPSLEYVIPVYYTIATAEASANLARFNGVRYGYRSKNGETPLELMQKSRNEGFGDEVKLRILLGTYVLRSGFQDQYYGKAQKIRTKIINEFKDIFSYSDIFVVPAFPSQAFRHGNAGLTQYQQKVADKFTVTANLTGLPALSLPVGVDNGLPVGVQFFADYCSENLLFDAARQLADVFPVATPPGFVPAEKIIG
ncbi:MAG: Asp-tRNA(Asn)/Glu-tRNA(Gln) amidotransferase subunit GatA [Spirochaetia bacterium]|nr:Asp-tRNA(Asn)/Glu-tRNA(Gln) amidotransferase subunit GatA [Spirochaetia bacterium]